MSLSSFKKIAPQFFRYALVGVGSNAIGYGLYLLITSIGFGSIQGMSLVYITACLISFVGNKRWTFADPSRSKSLLPRYFFSHIAGYLSNLLLLLAFHVQFGLPHQWVQLFAAIFVAIELFLLNKYYVFGDSKGTQIS